MRTDTPPTIRLSDYQPPSHLIDTVELTFDLSPTATVVTASLAIRPQTAAADLVLDGEDLALLSLAIDGTPLDAQAYTVTPATLTIPASALPVTPFTLTSQVRINPQANTALEGLYISKGMFCTQCEAQGFRKITYFPDRPDVMATYTVRLNGDLPVILSNGNLVDSGDGYAVWHDPWPKPSYLFALVAGDLTFVEDHFTTSENRDVTLRIYVRDGDQDKCGYAMDALKRSMAWDETAYGRAYDLDLFMIVAVDDFNAGAMENKGLNIFNAKYVLASPDTATDRDFELIEGIIAHEYFHNWTGNRITCRDWFQLCLKEGLTVYRDQQFSGDQRSHAVKRIDDVLTLRARQFREDAGPLAHPVRPTEYIEINNFYTATVYEKGAEVIGMLHRLVGDADYRRALDLYFDRHDGQACTIEDWITVFEDATGHDLTQFARWYTQAGTPSVSVEEIWGDGIFTLRLSQSTPATPGQTDKAPQVIPLAIGLLDPQGTETHATTVHTLTEAQQEIRFEGLDARPIPSINRGFSAPIVLDHPQAADRRTFLLAHDTDPFNRWEAGRMALRAAAGDLTRDPATAPDPALLDGLLAVLDDDALDPAFRALALGFPSLEDVFQDLAAQQAAPDPDAVRGALITLDTALAQHIPDLKGRLAALEVPGPYSPEADAAGKRALAARLLGLQTRLEPDAATARAAFEAADNMTQSASALGLLVRAGQADAALATFYGRWQAQPLVIDKWFSAQAALTPPDRAVEVVSALTDHADFDWRNPNRFRSLLGAFAMGNMAGFHRADGAGYALIADWLIKLDALNPMTTARMAGVFETWRQFDDDRQALILTQLQRIADRPGLSRDTSEIINRILEAPGA